MHDRRQCPVVQTERSRAGVGALGTRVPVGAEWHDWGRVHDRVTDARPGDECTTWGESWSCTRHRVVLLCVMPTCAVCRARAVDVSSAATGARPGDGCTTEGGYRSCGRSRGVQSGTGDVRAEPGRAGVPEPGGRSGVGRRVHDRATDARRGEGVWSCGRNRVVQAVRDQGGPGVRGGGWLRRRRRGRRRPGSRRGVRSGDRRGRPDGSGRCRPDSPGRGDRRRPKRPRTPSRDLR